MLSTNNLAADRLGQSTDGNSHSIYDNVNGAIHESPKEFRAAKRCTPFHPVQIRLTKSLLG